MMLFLTLAALLFAGPTGSQDQAPIRVESTGTGAWRATYTFQAPVQELRFARPANFYRESVWRVTTPGYRFDRRSGDQLVTRDDGAEARAVLTFEFSSFTGVIPKEYELFLAFTDGAVALYSGHFHATPTYVGQAGPARPVHALLVIPPGAAHAVVRGRVVEGPVRLPDDNGDGTYVYLGSAAPIETPHLLAIVDPGMPRWLLDQFESTLPALFDAFTERLGAPLPWKPLVLYSFRDTAASGYSSGGGTLTGLLTMTLEGRAWYERNEMAAAQAFHLLAHESAHLWNGQLVASPGGAESWMHEGSADAMANDLLLAFEVIDADRHRASRELAMNQCAAALAQGPLSSAADRGAFRAFYDCGAIMALWTEAALRRVRPDADLFSYWRTLIGAGLANDTSYDAPLYFSVLSDLGVSADAIAKMRSFVTAARSPEIAIAGLREAGMPVTVGQADPPVAFQRELARRAFGHVMATACGGMSFRAGSPIVTDPISGCAPFGEAHRIAGMEGFRVSDQGAAAYDAVAARCAEGGSIRLEGEDGGVVVAVACDRTPALDCVARRTGSSLSPTRAQAAACVTRSTHRTIP
jgi:hypothetical protein